MTDAERIADLQAAVTELQAVIGNYKKTLSHDDIQNRVGGTELPNGEYNVMFRQRQLGFGIDALAQIVGTFDDRIRALESRPVGDVQPSNALPLSAPIGAIAVREMRPLGANASRVYRSGDFDLAAETHTEPQAFMAPVGLGGPPIDGIPLAVRTGGQIVFAIRVPEAQTQEKSGDRDRLGAVLFEPHDNGVRLVQGGAWIKGTLNRVQDHVRILGMDSQGTVSKSDEDYSSPEAERGQLWIVQEDFEHHVIRIVPCRAGWGVEVAASTQTTNDHNEHNIDRRVPLIAPILQTRDIQAP